MNIKQLRLIAALAQAPGNLSALAAQMHTVQSGLSKQLTQLEKELGVTLFTRQGKRLGQPTDIGRTVTDLAVRICDLLDQIQTCAEDVTNSNVGTLTIATTHTQAKYLLPLVLPAFQQRFPQVRVHLQQSSPRAMLLSLKQGIVDIAICTEMMEEHKHDLRILPCYCWNRGVLVPADHPLAQLPSLTLDDVVQYPIITYSHGFTGRTLIDQVMQDNNLTPNIVLSVADSEVIKSYVRIRYGIGLIAEMAYDTTTDGDLAFLPLTAFFPCSTTCIATTADSYPRRYQQAFIDLLQQGGKQLAQSLSSQCHCI